MAKKMSTIKKEHPWKPDLNEVRRLCQLNCTDAEIGAFFGVCQKTVQRRKKEDPEFAEMIEQGRNFGKISLRRKQIEVAEEGNATMLVWLGKQYLGQKDKQDVEITELDRRGARDFGAEPITD